VEPIRAAELVGRRAAEPVVFDGFRIPGLPGGTLTRRQLPRLWQVRIPAAAQQAGAAYDIRYEVRGANGQPDRFSLVDYPQETIPVQVESLGTVYGRHPSGDTLIEGGVLLHLDLEGVRWAGDYRGTLIITVNGL
jgi:hypothetical protein